MTKEDKELLLKDLCARLPYKTMVKCNTDGRHEFDEELSEMHIMNFYQFEFKPYLRPMSSMTKREYAFIQAKTEGIKEPSLDFHIESLLPSGVIVDYLNENHFDYRGLIDKGFALEAPAGMYKNV